MKKMKRYNITNYRPGDEYLIRELFSEVYGRTFSLEAWRWQFFDNPYCDRQMVSVWDGEKLIAHTAVTLFRGHYRGKEFVVAYSGHTMASPNYLGISKLLLSEVKSCNKSIDMLYAFPNRNSFRIFRDVLCFNYLGDVCFVLAPVCKNRTCFTDEIREISAFTEEHGELYQQLIRKCDFITNRSLTRLNWRVLNKPDSGYRIFELRKASKLKGYIVLNLFRDEGELRGQIIDIMAPEPKDMDQLLEYARIWFGERNCNKAKMWMTSNYYADVLREQQFITPDLAFPLVTSQFNFNIQNAYLTMIDSDVF